MGTAEQGLEPMHPMDWLQSGGLAEVFAALEKRGNTEVMEMKKRMEEKADHEYEACVVTLRVVGGDTCGGTSGGATFEQNIPSCSSSAAGGRSPCHLMYPTARYSTPAGAWREDEAFEQSITFMAAENDYASLVQDLRKFGHAGSRQQQQNSACAALSNVGFSPRDLQRQIKDAGGEEVVRAAVSAANATSETKRLGNQLLEILNQV